MTLLIPGMTHPEVRILRANLSAAGFHPASLPSNLEFYDKALADTVHTFQATHVDIAGKWLDTDRKVGTKTWWALENHDGKAQAGIKPPAKPATKGLSGLRAMLIKLAFEWLRKPTRESPSGANWGGNVSTILAHAGGPRAWCMHFLSHLYKLATGEYPWGKDHGHVATFWREAIKRKAAHPVGDGYVPRPGDFGVILYKSAGKDEGHIFLVVAVEKGTALGYRFEAIGGNEGNAVKLSVRVSWARDFVGFVNIHGDDKEPYEPEGLKYSAKAGDSSHAATR